MRRKVETHYYYPSHTLLRCPMSFFKSSKLYSLFPSVFISTHFGETLNPWRHMNGNVTSHMWHQTTNQIPDWCEKAITWSIFDLCHWLTGGEKWKKKKTTKEGMSHFWHDNWKLRVQLYQCQTSWIIDYVSNVDRRCTVKGKNDIQILGSQRNGKKMEKLKKELMIMSHYPSRTQPSFHVFN